MPVSVQSHTCTFLHQCNLKNQLQMGQHMAGEHNTVVINGDMECSDADI